MMRDIIIVTVTDDRQVLKDRLANDDDYFGAG